MNIPTSSADICIKYYAASGYIGTTNLLTRPRKMPGMAFSLPSGPPQHGGSCKVRTSMCVFCYARYMNAFKFPKVNRAHLVRFAWVSAALQTGEFTDVMIKAIRRVSGFGPDIHFRGHPSGDFFSKEYIAAWTTICGNVPSVKFWFPTRIWNDPELQPPLRQLACLQNVSIRPSALEINASPPDPEGLSAGSTVVTDCNFQKPPVKMCPKSLHHGVACEQIPCFDCWNKEGPPIAYLIHGENGRHSLRRPTATVIANVSRERRLFLSQGPFRFEILGI